MRVGSMIAMAMVVRMIVSMSDAFGMPAALRSVTQLVEPGRRTAALALIPLALRGHLSGNEIQSPMAKVILGGLLTSTLLNIYIVPIFYNLLHKLGISSKIKKDDLNTFNLLKGRVFSKTTAFKKYLPR